MRQYRVGKDTMRRLKNSYANILLIINSFLYLQAFEFKMAPLLNGKQR
jgi:hypothetical protein